MTREEYDNFRKALATKTDDELSEAWLDDQFTILDLEQALETYYLRATAIHHEEHRRANDS
jgi:hypothetical protein